MPDPQVTVVIPTRNRRRTLARSLESALAQRGVEVEVVVVDEASEDDTGAYLAALDEPRVTLVRHETPLGVAAARNAGLARARARWTAFLDDDDLWAPDKLAPQLDALAGSAEARWSCVAALVLDEALRVVDAERPPAQEDDLLELLFVYNAIPGGGSGIVADTELLRSLGGFDPALRVIADWDMWIRLALAAPLVSLDRPLLAYVRHTGSMSRDLAAIDGELEHVETKHAAAREEWGIAFDRDPWLLWIAWMHQMEGRRLEPARIYAALARRRRRPLWLARSALTLAWPGWVEVRDRRSVRRVPPEWIEEAERWLARFRDEHSPQSRAH